MKRISLLFAVFMMLVSLSPAWADQLSDAKHSGLIGERADGYLGTVKPNPVPEVTQLVNSVNAARKAEYVKIAQHNSQSLDVVEKLAGAKLIERTQAGNFVMTPDGGWVMK